jgi:hypothetical protein
LTWLPWLASGFKQGGSARKIAGLQYLQET